MYGRKTNDDYDFDFDNGPRSSVGQIGGGGAPARGPGTSAGRPLVSSMGGGGRGLGAGARLSTGASGGVGEARPLTSVSGAGYQGSKDASRLSGGSFDPLALGKGPAEPLAEKSENSAEDKAKEMEKNVHRLIEASAEMIANKDMRGALEKAKEAGKAERALCKFRESKSLVDQINIDLTYAVCFNLANAYHHNKMYEEALNTYQLIVKNKQYPQSGRLRVNMGNIHYEQKKYPQAIKMYRMALDQIPATGKELRWRILRNIGNAFVKMGQFQDAIESYDTVMANSPDMQTAFNLLLCLYARGDKDKMRRHFSKMLTIPVVGMTEEDEERLKEHYSNAASPNLDVNLAALDRPDGLREELQRRYEVTNERILVAARLVAPVLGSEPSIRGGGGDDDASGGKVDWAAGYKWIMEQLRQDHEDVSSKLEIDMSMMFMKEKRFDDALEVLKSFERKDASLRAIAATNLSFIYFLEGEYQLADKQADVAIRADRYNAKALVNKGNCLFAAGDYGRARDMYLEAVGVEADCVEAIFNLGLVNLRLNAVTEAHHAFDKLHTILPSVPEALFQLGAIYEMGNSAENLEQAAKTYELLLNKVPGDPNLCCRLGAVYEKLEDESSACHWYTEAHRFSPVNLNVISWLGVWYVKREMYEQAIEYFERASAVQPAEVKWQLMVTSCYRRLGDYYKALELYQKVRAPLPLLFSLFSPLLRRPAFYLTSLFPLSKINKLYNSRADSRVPP